MSEPLAGYPFVVEIPVAWGEMDAMGHVNNAVYFRYFETARIALFRKLDWYGRGPHGGVGPILASTQARFKIPVTYPDTLHVGVRILDVGEDRFTIDQRIVSQRLGAATTEGQALIVAYDYQAGKKAKLPDDLRKRIAELGNAPG